MRAKAMTLLLPGVLWIGSSRTLAQEPGPSLFGCGDANGDARIDISDAVYLLNFLFLGDKPPVCSIEPQIEDEEGTCNTMALKTQEASRHEALSEYWLVRARCDNLDDLEEAERCEEEAQATLHEARAFIDEQFRARRDLCEALGEVRYNPAINPEDFLTPEETAADPNPYYPLVPGTTFRYAAETAEGGELNEVLVTEETREILGVTCVVVSDTVLVDGEIVEGTRDWYAQDRDGNVWYFGELTVEYEDGEIVGIEGSWEAGVDGARPGLIMKAAPQVGDAYRQEFSIGQVEDAAAILGLSEPVTVPFGSFDDCLMTGESTPIAPGVLDHKFYAPGVGFVLEVKPLSGERLELMAIEHEWDSRIVGPQPTPVSGSFSVQRVA
jgi:hypothetical protein